MSSSDLKSKLSLEFEEVVQGKNPEITADIEAIVVLSGESRDPAIKTKLYDTEERLAEGIRIYKEVEWLGGSPILVLNGTDPQNVFMEDESRKNGILRIKTIKNPSVPSASTDTQLKGLQKFNFRKVAIVTHAYHGVRTRMNALKRLPNSMNFELFLLNRGGVKDEDIEMEIEKIKKYLK